MGFKVGKRIENTYISTNGRSVRTTTRVGKNVYYSKRWGKRTRHTGHAGLGVWTFAIISTIIVWNICCGILGINELRFTMNDFWMLWNLIPEDFKALMFYMISGFLISPLIVLKMFK